MDQTPQPTPSAPNYWADDTLDLRTYVELILHQWWLILGCALLAAVTAFAVTSLQAPTYQASSIVIITEPRYQMQFDARFQTADQWQPAYNAFPELAASDTVLKTVVQAYVPSPAAHIEEWKLSVLRDIAEATSQGDPSLVKLQVACRSPEDAAGIANAWADQFSARGNDIYADGEDDLAFFQTQAAQAETTLEDAEQALIAFQARDRASIVDAQLGSLRQTQADYLADQRAVTYLTQDIRGLRDQLAQQPDSQPASLGDELTSLFLQIKAFNAGASAPIELQVTSPESLSQKSRAEQVAFLDDLTETLAAKTSAIDGRLDDLEPDILALQQELQSIRTEEQRLKRAQSVAEETYMTLSRKLEEARIAAQEKSGILQVGSYAAVPERPTGPRRLQNTALAGVVGAMIGLGAVFTWEWWRADPLEQGS